MPWKVRDRHRLTARQALLATLLAAAAGVLACLMTGGGRRLFALAEDKVLERMDREQASAVERALRERAAGRK